MRFLFFTFTILLALASCQKNDSGTAQSNIDSEYLNLPTTPFNYANQNLPAHIFNDAAVLAADNTPFNNSVTNHGATLGRVLFYDKSLSKTRTISCASCHKQETGFSDDLVLSEGFDGGKTGRHSMGLTNARFYNNGRFFWDERAASLEEQVLLPIQDSIEMGLTLDTLVERVQSLPYYSSLFEKAFGDETVSSEKISLALAQFVRSMMSYQSKYDEGRAQVNTPNQPFPNYTPLENQGKNIFFNPQLGACAGCHGTEAFVSPGPRNNGLEAVSIDQGIGGVNGNPNQVGQFKSPSLRNIADRAPYMHDGRFTNLEEVVEHYNSGVQDHPNLSAPLRQPDNTVRTLNLSQVQKNALIAFLNTLSDDAIAYDEKFSDPFKL